MKININTEHNSLELDFEGAKPSDELRKVMKSYGFWWFQKEKKWIHSLEVDAEFFKEFVENRIKPLVAAPVPADPAAVAAAVSAMGDDARQALLAQLLGQ